MKHILIFTACAGLLSLLAACASLPAPKSADDSLVVGRFVLSFPDGFFDRQPRSIDSWVLLHFYLPGERRHVSVFTSDGYFRFRSRGAEELILTGYDLTLRDNGVEYQLTDRLDQRFTALPHEVVYLGQTKVSYTKPQQVNGQSIGLESYTVENTMGATWKYEYWDFGRSITRSRDRQGLTKYLEKKGPRSPWLNYEVYQGS
jgi:hypothetical protein